MRLPRILLVSALSVAIPMAAACSKSSATAPSASTASCTVTLGAVTTSVSGAASTGTLPVTAASSCSWAAASSASYLTITSGSTGTGNGSVAYSFAANTGDARSASITVNGTSVVFTQAAPVLIAPTGCAVTLSSTTAKVNSGGGTVNLPVTAASNCQWTATSNASFLSVPSGTVTGNSTLVVTATQNAGPSRSGTLTIGGQTVTITQDAGVVASFAMFDPAQTAGPTNVCQFRSAVGGQTTCTLRSTSFTGGTAGISTFTWTVQYTNGTAKAFAVSSSASDFSFTDACGSAQATDDGAMNPLDVTLTVSDANGNTATAKSNSGNQAAMFVQMFTCGK